jgi:hypothetical protein
LRLEEYCRENKIPYIAFDTFADIQKEIINITREDQKVTKGYGKPVQYNVSTMISKDLSNLFLTLNPSLAPTFGEKPSRRRRYLALSEMLRKRTSYISGPRHFPSRSLQPRILLLHQVLSQPPPSKSTVGSHRDRYILFKRFSDMPLCFFTTFKTLAR